MYDSVTPSAIPANAQMVAGYINGRFAWSSTEWARFPHAVKVRIATRSNVNDGHVLDVETGDATPTQAVAWVKMRRLAGQDPSVYCNLSLWPSVKAAFSSAGVAQPHYWIAHYDGSRDIPAGAIAKQYNDPPGGSGGNWDISAVADNWPGVDSGSNSVEDDLTPEEHTWLSAVYQGMFTGSHTATATYPALLDIEVETQKRVTDLDAHTSAQFAAAVPQLTQAVQAAAQGVDTHVSTQLATVDGHVQAFDVPAVDPEAVAQAVTAALQPVITAAVNAALAASNAPTPQANAEALVHLIATMDEAA